MAYLNGIKSVWKYYCYIHFIPSKIYKYSLILNTHTKYHTSILSSDNYMCPLPTMCEWQFTANLSIQKNARRYHMCLLLFYFLYSQHWLVFINTYSFDIYAHQVHIVINQCVKFKLTIFRVRRPNTYFGEWEI